MKKLRRIKVGQAGEEMAVRYLEEQGYEILERNYRCRLGEIDIIAQDGDCIVFVEVKARGTTNYGYPEAAVGFFKQRKIAMVALHYLQNRGPVNARFDVVAITKTTAGVELQLIKNAFEMSP